MQSQESPVVALLGIGRWGKNLVRIFESITDVRYCLHQGDSENRQWLRNTYPDVKVAEAYEEILTDDVVDAVVIATPMGTHADFAARALEADKHVFVEKPLTTLDEDPAPLIRTAQSRGLTLFVGYIFLYHEAFEVLAEWQDDIVRLVQDWRKLGSFDSGIVENLVSHEVAIARRLLGDEIVEINPATTFGSEGRIDGLRTALEFSNGSRSDLAVTRISPTKEKSVTALTESGGVLVWIDDAVWHLEENGREFDLIHESSEEALQREARAFLCAINSNETPLTDGEFAAAVDRTLEQIAIRIRS